MNENMNYGAEDETEIDLGNLFAAILRKWKMILVWMIVCAAVIGGVWSYSESAASQNKYSDEAGEALQESLTASQVDEVNRLYVSYTSYQNKIRNSQEYLENSILMNLDPNTVSSEHIEYVVDSAQANVIDSYAAQTLGDDEYAQIADVLNSEDVKADPHYVYEVVNISRVGSRDNDDVNIESSGEGDVLNGGTISSTYNDLMDVSITATSKDQCEKIAGIVTTALDAHTQQLAAAGIDVNITEVDRKYTENNGSWLSTQQENVIAQNSQLLSDYQNFQTSNINNLESDEKDYFDYLVGRGDAKVDHVSVARYVMIGALIGLAAAVVVVIISYLGSQKIHTVDEIRMALDRFTMTDGNPTILGVVSHPEKAHHFLGKIFMSGANAIERRAFPQGSGDGDAYVALVAKRIAKACERNGVGSLYLVNCYGNAYADQVRNALTGGLGSLSHVSSGRPTQAAEDLEQLSGSDAAVIMCGLNDTRRADLDENVQLCVENGVSVVGVVVVNVEA